MLHTDAKDILNEFQSEWNKKEGYPHLFCNAASRALQKVLSEKGIEVEQQFTYLDIWEWHTFLRTKDGLIIDPTYWQYDLQYKYTWFIWEEFPIPELNTNIMQPEDFMKLQIKRLDDWLIKL